MLFGIIVVANLAIFAIVKRIVFKKSVVLNATNPITLSNLLIVCISYYAGTLELSRAVMLAPLVLLSILFSYIGLRRQLKKPFDLLQTQTSQLTQGNLSVDDVLYQKQDEIGNLTIAINQHKEMLRTLKSEVESASSEISETETQLASDSHKLAEIANRQAASLESVSTSVEKLYTNVKQSGQHALATRQIATQASEKLQNVGQASVESLQSIETITQKIGIINDIATQTNILALNAAVEAARAGDHGKGFAVVATEVRKLAERCRQAADEITQMSEQMVKSATATNQLLSNLIPDMERNAVLMQEVTASTHEQVNDIENINRSVKELNQNGQDSVTISETLTERTSQLSSQFSKLNGAIAYFK